jgi:hypothetical protein
MHVVEKLGVFVQIVTPGDDLGDDGVEVAGKRHVVAGSGSVCFDNLSILIAGSRRRRISPSASASTGGEAARYASNMAGISNFSAAFKRHFGVAPSRLDRIAD